MNKILSIQYVRAITIFTIVMWHAVGSCNIEFSSLTFKLADFFFSDGTTAFVVISGFFLQHFINRYDTKTFYLSKFKNIVIPYLILLIITSLIFNVDFNYLIGQPKEFLKFIIAPPNWSLWFIPMILTIFILSPALYFISYKNNLFVAVVCVIIVITIPRGGTFDQNLYQFFLYNLMHFTPCFILGMWYRMSFLEINSYIDKNLKSVTCCFIILSLFVLLIKLDVIHSSPNMSSYRIVTLVMLVFLFEKVKINAKCSKLMSFLGDISFTIFFIHVPIILEIQNFSVVEDTINQLNPYQKVLYSFFLSLILLLICSMIAISAKKIMKQYSRYLIGY